MSKFKFSIGSIRNAIQTMREKRQDKKIKEKLIQQTKEDFNQFKSDLKQDKTKILSDDEIQFTTFTPKIQSRFIVHIDGIASFLICGVELPKVRFLVDVNDKSVTKSLEGDLVLKLYNPIAPSAEEQLESLIGKTIEKIRIDILGPVGDIVDQYQLYNLQLKEIQYPKLDWFSNDTSKITARFSVDKMIREFEETTE